MSKGGSDTYEFSKQIDYINVVGREQGAGEVILTFTGGLGYHGAAAVDITGKGGGPGTYNHVLFYTTDDVSRPGDGTLEGPDGVCPNWEANCGESYTYGGGHDHFDTEGRLTEVRIDPAEKDKTVALNRYVGSTW